MGPETDDYILVMSWILELLDLTFDFIKIRSKAKEL